jgi:ATP-dependent DNA helicase RecG
VKEHQNIEFKREWQDDFLEQICGLANAKGGTMYVGIDDEGKYVGLKNPRKLLKDIPNKIRQRLGIVVDVNLREDEELPFLEIVVEPQQVPISCGGMYYRRSGATNQKLTGSALQNFMLEKHGRNWESSPHPRAELADFDEKLIRKFVERAISKKRMSEDGRILTVHELLDKLHLVRDGYYTNAALLLFSDPDKWVPGAYIRVGFFEEAEVIYHDEIHGPILEQVDKAMDLIYFKYLKAKISYEGIERVERYPFPEDAVRESIMNAAAHKDYASEIPIQIRVYDDKMCVSNICQLPPGLTKERLLSSHPSQPHNPSIARVFYYAGHIEEWGRGIKKMVDACRIDNIYPPDFQVYQTDFTVEFTAPEERVIRKIGRAHV